MLKNYPPIYHARKIRNIVLVANWMACKQFQAISKVATHSDE